jgi:hypothetical protein
MEFLVAAEFIDELSDECSGMATGFVATGFSCERWWSIPWVSSWASS